LAPLWWTAIVTLVGFWSFAATAGGQPLEAPPGSTPLSMHEIFSDQNSGIPQPRRDVIRSAGQWQSIVDQLGPRRPAAPVDFDRSMVILATMGMAQYKNSVIRAKEGVLKEDLFQMRDAIDQYYADKGKYPVALDALVTDGYVRRIPKDPFTDNAETWQTVPSDPDPNNPTAEPGIYDVKSGSDATALDGTKYAEW